MLIKVSEATNNQLNWLVGRAMGLNLWVNLLRTINEKLLRNGHFNVDILKALQQE